MSDERVVWSPLPGSQTLAMSCPAQIIVYHGSRGPGKDICVNTQVLTAKGFKRAGDITYDDKLISLDGTETNILGIYPQGTNQLYKVTFHDGEVINAGKDHRWLTLNSATGYREGWKIRTTEFLMNMKTQCSVPYMHGSLPEITKYEGPDPYIVGYIIANGTTYKGNGTVVYSIDDEILDYIVKTQKWTKAKYKSTDSRAWCKAETNQQWVDLLGLKRGDQKCVPQSILEGNREVRLACLQGLMDGDGNCEGGATSRYSTVSEQLAKDVVYLVKSLGGRATYVLTIITDEQQAKRRGGRQWIYHVNLSHHNQFNPFRVTRKANRYKEQKKFLTRGIKSIEPSIISESVCFAVDHESHCFVIGDFVVTHNTDSQLMRFRAKVGQGYGRHWRGVIFDREYKNLDDLVSKSQRWFPEFKDGCRFINSKSDYKWVWKTGEELLFRTVKKDQDYWGFHGQEFPFIGWNELTKYPNQNLFEMMMSCNRSSFRPEDYPYYINKDLFDKKGLIQYVGSNHKFAEQKFLPEIRLEVFATCNPHGSGHNWVKRRFISASKMGEILKNKVNVYNPRTQKREDIFKTQTHIFGSYRENKYLSPEYVATLESIDEPNKRRAWLMGDWDVVAGGMFDDLWDSKLHIVSPFDVPDTWRIDRSFDWGSSHPFSVGWWAESDGCDVKLQDGTIRSTIRGDIYRIGEWYGWTGRPNEGLRMLANDIATGIIERELVMGIYDRVNPGPADNSIYDVENGNSIGASMAMPVRINGKNYPGVTWIRSDKSSGSRKAGWEKMRLYMKQAKRAFTINPETFEKIYTPREKAGLFIFDSCKMFIDLVPILPRDDVDPDDVDTDAEDHIGDEARYKLLSIGIGAKGGRTSGTY